MFLICFSISFTTCLQKNTEENIFWFSFMLFPSRINVALFIKGLLIDADLSSAALTINDIEVFDVVLPVLRKDFKPDLFFFSWEQGLLSTKEDFEKSTVMLASFRRQVSFISLSICFCWLQCWMMGIEESISFCSCSYSFWCCSCSFMLSSI